MRSDAESRHNTQKTFRYYPNGMPIDELFQRKRMIQLEGREVFALSLTDEVIFHCVHGAKDFWEKLMWICDVASLTKNHPEIDWQSTWRAAADCGGTRMVSVGLMLGADVLGMPCQRPSRRESHAITPASDSVPRFRLGCRLASVRRRRCKVARCTA